MDRFQFQKAFKKMFGFMVGLSFNSFHVVNLKSQIAYELHYEIKGT